MKWKELNWYFFFILCLLKFQVFGAIVDYADEEIQTNEYDGDTIAMYTPQDSPFGGTTSYISFSVQFSTTADTDQLVEVTLYFSDNNNDVGAPNGDVCCWENLYAQGKCSNLGGLITETIPDPANYHYWGFNISSNSSYSLSGYFPVTKTGVWYFFFFKCGTDKSQTQPTILVNGKSVWKNPYGQLPGSLLGFLPLYWLLTFGFLVFGIIWAILTIKYRQGLMNLQNAIAIVILTGFIENLVFALNYTVYNSTGIISLPFNIFSVFFSTIKRTVAFFCLVLVAKGFTIYRPNMEKRDWILLIIFIIIYFVLSGIYQFIDTLRSTPSAQSLDISLAAEYVFFVLSLIVNFIILGWMFISIFYSITYLATKKQEVKLKMYKIVGLILLISYAITFFFLIVELGAILGNLFDSWWRGWWIWSGYYSILHFLLTVIIGWIWRPNSNNGQYAYQQVDIEMETKKEVIGEGSDIKSESKQQTLEEEGSDINEQTD